MEEMLTYMHRAVVACSENIIQLTFCVFESDCKDPILHSLSHVSSQGSVEQPRIIIKEML